MSTEYSDPESGYACTFCGRPVGEMHRPSCEMRALLETAYRGRRGRSVFGVAFVVHGTRAIVARRTLADIGDDRIGTEDIGPLPDMLALAEYSYLSGMVERFGHGGI